MGKAPDSLWMGQEKIAVWGLGYLGYSNLLNLTNHGIRCAVTDIDAARIKAFEQEGFPRSSHLQSWEIAPILDKSLIEVVEEPEELAGRGDIYMHILCVQNETLDGKPTGVHVEEAFDMMCGSFSHSNDKGLPRPLVVIESSMEPHFFQRKLAPIIQKHGLKLNRDMGMGILPRLDWSFLEFYKQTRHRIIAASDRQAAKRIGKVVEMTGAVPVIIPELVSGELISHLLNAKKHVENALVNQVSMAYPGVDMNRIIRALRLAGQDMPSDVSLGISGYRLPVSCQLLLEGADNPGYLTMLQEALLTDFSMPQKVLELSQRRGVTNVGILGLSSAKNRKDHILSISAKMAKLLLDRGFTVELSDPLYEPDEIRGICGAESFPFPEGLGRFDGLVFMQDHSAFLAIGLNALCEHIKRCKLIVDNTGLLASDSARAILAGVDLRIVGQSGWLQ